MNTKTTINVTVFITNILVITVISLTALWSSLSNLMYFLWIFTGIMSTIYFAFFFNRFTNWKEFIYKSLLHGAFTYFVLVVFSSIQAIIRVLIEAF
ncbi:hypothetical protein [Bacillus marinisedimentorum]|uniref:hypothetical protein n=1 Tax=Bacillus marinisedimentorum TaxID=1821260 RepID=UPI0007E218F8|nr:hypothetical protein [Bacillus marinisedimentorum]